MLHTTIKSFLRTKKTYLFFLLLLSISIQLATTSIPVMSSSLIDSLVKKDIHSCIFSLTIISFLLFINLVLQYIFKVKKIKIQQLLSFHIQWNATTALYKNYIETSEHNNLTILSQNVLTDSSVIADFIFETLIELFNNFIILIISFFILFRLNLLFFLIALLSIPFYLVATVLIQPRASKLMEKSKVSQSEYNSGVIKIVQTIKTLKKYSNFHKLRAYNSSIFNQQYIYYLKTYKLLFVFYSIGSIFTSLIQIVFYYIGIKLIISNQLTIGQFTIVLSFYGFLLSSIDYFLNFFESFNNFFASWNRMNNNDSLKITAPSRKECTYSIKKIQKLNAESFIWSFNDKSLKFPPFFVNVGDLLIINGANGTGKTTLLNILSGIYEPPPNKIFINDLPILSVDMNNLRKNNIAICDANMQFILDDVLENIQFYLGNTAITSKKIREFIIDTHLQQMFGDIEILLHSKVGDLSTGQQKKISILICLLKTPDLLVLDEPTVGLDVTSKSCLTQFLNGYKLNHIVLIVSHEPIFEEISTKTINISN
ncbi:ATP-binding cassette domain-containing protein [Levilactobacillus brevis]